MGEKVIEFTITVRNIDPEKEMKILLERYEDRTTEFSDPINVWKEKRFVVEYNGSYYMAIVKEHEVFTPRSPYDDELEDNDEKFYETKIKVELIQILPELVKELEKEWSREDGDFLRYVALRLENKIAEVLGR